MISHQYLKVSALIVLLNFTGIIAQDGKIQDQEEPKPKLPDVFQVQVQGIFMEETTEVDATIYYDRINNRAVLSYTFQNETTTTIYDFNKSQQIYIDGVDCTVSNITKETGVFFPYSTNDTTQQKTIGSPEEILYFTNSTLVRQDLMLLPSYIYTSVQDFPMYGLNNCDVSHVFSKPELELSQCESHSCKSTIISLSVRCPEVPGETEEINHIYNFYRFRSSIKDESVFQPPVGVHCQIKGQKPFPKFPRYYSFSYDLIKEIKYSDRSAGVYITHKRIWHDTKLKLIRMDEFDKEGLVEATRIFDFYGKIAYTIIADLPLCHPDSLEEEFDLGKMTLLPSIFFSSDETNDVVYIGKRSIHGLDFDVWTQSVEDPETEAKIVHEFHFTNNIQDGELAENNYLQLSHVDIYTYEKEITGPRKYKLSLLTYLSISNFRTKPEEWEAFDIASCFNGDERRGFRLKVEGPPIVRNSFMYEEVLEKLYIKLIMLTNVSVVRISQLKGRFDGMSITEFTGWILKKVYLKESKIKNKEPDMAETYNLIEKAAADGKLTLRVKKSNETQIYKVTAVSELIQIEKSCISGGTLAAVSLVLLFMGITIGGVGFYVFLKKRTPQSKDQVHLQTLEKH